MTDRERTRREGLSLSLFLSEPRLRAPIISLSSVVEGRRESEVLKTGTERDAPIRAPARLNVLSNLPLHFVILEPLLPLFPSVTHSRSLSLLYTRTHSDFRSVVVSHESLSRHVHIIILHLLVIESLGLAHSLALVVVKNSNHQLPPTHITQ